MNHICTVVLTCDERHIFRVISLSRDFLTGFSSLVWKTVYLNLSEPEKCRSHIVIPNIQRCSTLRQSRDMKLRSHLNLRLLDLDLHYSLTSFSIRVSQMSQCNVPIKSVDVHGLEPTVVGVNKSQVARVETRAIFYA